MPLNACKQCNASFAKKSQLTTHVKNDHQMFVRVVYNNGDISSLERSEDGFQCRCNRRFGNPSTLQKHAKKCTLGGPTLELIEGPVEEQETENMSVDSSFDDSSSEGQSVEEQVQDQLTEFNDETISSQKRKNFYLVSSRCTTKVDVPEEGQRLKDALLLNHKVVSNPYEQSGVYSHRDKLANEFVNHFGIHHFVNKFLDANNQGLKGRMVLRTFVMEETEGRSMIFANVRAAVSLYFLNIQKYLKDGSSNYHWRREVMKCEKDAPTSDLRCLEPETVKRYSGIWADMVMMVLRTMCDESEEEHKSLYLSFSGLNFVNPEQAELAEKLIAEAAIFPRDDVMQELVHDLSLSMILVEKNSGQPEETLNVMDTFTMLSCIGPNGEWRPVQQATQISAALLYNSRASVLYEIMQQEQQKRPEE